MTTNTPSLAFAVLRLTLRVGRSAPLLLPNYTGSTFHGLLAKLLTRVHYGTKPACYHCPIHQQCRDHDLASYLLNAPASHPLLADNYQALQDLYPDRALRHQRDLIAPFCMGAPAGGRYTQNEALHLHLTLIGKGVECWPFLCCALEHLPDYHVGRHQAARLTTEQVVSLDPNGVTPPVSLYDPYIGRLPNPVSTVSLLDFQQQEEHSPTGISLQFSTPVKLYRQTVSKGNGQSRSRRQLNPSPRFSHLFSDLLRRLLLLSLHDPAPLQLLRAELLNLADEVTSLEDRLVRTQISRGRNPSLEGLEGQLRFTGELSPFLPLLRIGEFLHLGKLPTKGFGHYRLTYFQPTPLS